MARYHATVQSRSPAAETFGYLAAFSNAAEWDPGGLAGEQLDAGPPGAGSRFRLKVPFLGARMSLTYEVIRFVPDREGSPVCCQCRAAIHRPDRSDRRCERLGGQL